MKEKLGRLYLWQIAINRIIELLELRNRVDRFNKTGRPLFITEAYDKERLRLKTGLRLAGEELNKFEKEYGSLFPEILDIQLINELITEEIIIKFCTIFNEGHGKEGLVASNKKFFWRPIISDIISDAFTDEIKVKFNEFIDNAKAYRDKHGAHFDQESFIVKHGNIRPNEDGIIYSVGWSNALLTFNWDFISETIPVFNASLILYIRKLQEEAGLI